MLAQVIAVLPADINNRSDRLKLKLPTGKTKNVDLVKCSQHVIDRSRGGDGFPFEVECEDSKGLLKDVRMPGELVDRKPPPALKAEDRPTLSHAQSAQARPAAPKPALRGEFHNPYSFVPLVRRPSDGPFADSPPVSLDRMHDGTWSGRLSVRWTATTPLLIPDMARAQIMHDHPTVPIRVDHHGLPYLSATSIKGVIRSALEAITSSRFGVADEAMSTERVGFRHTTDEAVKQAVRLERQGDKLQGRLMNVARLPVALAESVQHGGRAYATFVQGDAGPIVETLEPQEAPGTTPGWVLRTGESIAGKRHERFLYGGTTLIPLAPGVEKAWHDLLANAKNSCGPTPPGKEWPSHLQPNSTRGEFAEGLLAWVVIEKNFVVSLLPSMISRDLYPDTPAQRMPKEFRPADDFEELSFTDRLFGWVGTGDGRGNARRVRQLRGRVRFLPAHGSKPVQAFDQPVPLQILSSPKAQQGRFYLGVRDDTGVVRPVKRGTRRAEAGYRDPNVQRGFKVYPHHRQHVDGAADYWNPSADPLLTEWKRPNPTQGSNKDDQNRSITGWVAPETTFTFDIWVDGLTEVELGALCFMLDLGSDEGRMLRVGGGKPLGFGSVDSRIVAAELSPYRAVVERWTSWSAPAPAPAFDEVINSARSAFLDALSSSFGDNPPQLVAFLRSSTGVDLPVRYPRRSRSVDRDGKSYEWFVANDRIERRDLKHGYPLPDLAAPQEVDGLPYFG